MTPNCISPSVCPAEKRYHHENGKERQEYACKNKKEVEHRVRIADNPIACHSEEGDYGAGYPVEGIVPHSSHSLFLFKFIGLAIPL